MEETLVYLEALANKKQILFNDVPTTLPLLDNLSSTVKQIKAMTVTPTGIHLFYKLIDLFD